MYNAHLLAKPVNIVPIYNRLKVGTAEQNKLAHMIQREKSPPPKIEMLPTASTNIHFGDQANRY